ncbi:hypothetical protein GMMP15_390015 [Candidatus Magnetomoraceae bacterium gMMP-15]
MEDYLEITKEFENKKKQYTDIEDQYQQTLTEIKNMFSDLVKFETEMAVMDDKVKKIISLK